MNNLKLVASIAENHLNNKFNDLKLMTPVSSPKGGYRWSTVQIVFTADKNKLLLKLKAVIVKHCNIQYMEGLKNGQVVDAKQAAHLKLPRVKLVTNKT